MPELPEVEILCRRLDERLAGQRFDKLELASISALKTFDPLLSALEHRRIAGVHRRGKFICVGVDGDWLIFNLARSGWLRWRDRFAATAAARPGRGPLALRARLESGAGFEVTEMSTDKRLAIYAAHDPDEIEAIATLGPEPLDGSFTKERLAAVLAKEKGDVKHAISRQSLIAGVGNAYSDEALHAAGLSPFKPVANLSPGEIDRLYNALVGALRDGIERAAALDLDELKDGKRSGMRVHGRAGQACPVCGDTIREVSFASRSLQYCPTCQTGGKPLADRRLSRLLK
jgi:formamidopyrimidine-DNA glycosylase